MRHRKLIYTLLILSVFASYGYSARLYDGVDDIDVSNEARNQAYLSSIIATTHTWMYWVYICSSAVTNNFEARMVVFYLASNFSSTQFDNLPQIKNNRSANTVASNNVYTPLVPNKWYHVTSQWSDGQLRMYINGELVDSDASPASMNTGAHQIVFGRAAVTSVGYFNGYIAQLKLFNKALTITEIKNEMWAYIPSESCKMWLAFDKDKSNIAEQYDMMPQKFKLTTGTGINMANFNPPITPLMGELP